MAWNITFQSRDRIRTAAVVVRCRKNATCLIIVFVVALISYPGTSAATDPALELAASCQSCHRPDRAESAIPALVGQDENSIATSLWAYRDDDRRSHIMRAVARSLTPEEIGLVAHYLAQQGKRAKAP